MGVARVWGIIGCAGIVFGVNVASLIESSQCHLQMTRFAVSQILYLQAARVT